MEITESQKRIHIAQELLQNVGDVTSNSMRSFIVYGSTVLGTAKENSDIDIMVLVDFHNRTFLKNLQESINTLQDKSNILITVNFKKVSDFLKEITEGNHYYVHIALKGNCLMESKVFQGLQSIVETNSLPTQEELISKNAADTHMRVNQLFLGSLVKFCTGIRITILKYLDLHLLQGMELSTWNEYQNNIQRSSYEPTIRKYLPQYADNVIAFFALSDHVKPMGFNLEILDSLEAIKFVELLECIEFIRTDSQAIINLN